MQEWCNKIDQIYFVAALLQSFLQKREIFSSYCFLSFILLFEKYFYVTIEFFLINRILNTRKNVYVVNWAVERKKSVCGIKESKNGWQTYFFFYTENPPLWDGNNPYYKNKQMKEAIKAKQIEHFNNKYTFDQNFHFDFFTCSIFPRILFQHFFFVFIYFLLNSFELFFSFEISEMIAQFILNGYTVYKFQARTKQQLHCMIAEKTLV